MCKTLLLNLDFTKKLCRDPIDPQITVNRLIFFDPWTKLKVGPSNTVIVFIEFIIEKDYLGFINPTTGTVFHKCIH